MKYDSRILILDDEFLVLLNLMTELQRTGFSNIETANNTESALACVAAGKVDAAFLDVNLGSETSYTVASVLKERQIPFAFVTGYGKEAIEAEFKGVPVFTKPVSSGDVDEFLEQFVN